MGALLVQAERTLTSAKGLPRRPWFTHQIYAPGFYTGYGVKTLPGVREAIEERQWKEFEQQAAATAEAIDRSGPRICAARPTRSARSRKLPLPSFPPREISRAERGMTRRGRLARRRRRVDVAAELIVVVLDPVPIRERQRRAVLRERWRHLDRCGRGSRPGFA